MSIVLNEREWAEEAIKTKSLGKKPYETLTRVACYYFDNGGTKNTIRKNLENFLLQCDPFASTVKWADFLDTVIFRASKKKLLEIDGIKISKKELDAIKSVDGVQLQRLAFTLLCLAKYWDIVNGREDHWVNSKDNEIMSMANINTSIKRQSSMYNKLNEAGLIQFSKKVDNTNVRVTFIDNGPAAMIVDDFRNLGYQYLKYTGSPLYFKCTNCGIVTKRSTKDDTLHHPRGGPKYCRECAIEIQTRQKVNYVMKRRSFGDNCEKSNCT